jgi:CRISPR/Cas system endoribonuclease Cas6 (RAMP superfamily)
MYAGELTEFLPWLRAGEYSGVGRQTSWGKGEIRVRRIVPRQL